MLGLKPQQFGRSIKQFFNIADNGVDYGNWITIGSGHTVDGNGIEFTVFGSANLAYLPESFMQGLKSSTLYTGFVELDIDESTGNGLWIGTEADPSNSIVQTKSINFIKGIGITSFTFTTPSNISGKRYIFYSSSSNQTGERIRMKSFVVVEGNITSENITEEQPYGNFDVIYTP